MAKQGYTATRVEQICNEAGVTKGAFFHYFKTKDDLGKQTIKHYNDVVQQTWFESGDWRDEEDPLRRVFAHLAYEEKNFMPVLMFSHLSQLSLNPRCASDMTSIKKKTSAKLPQKKCASLSCRFSVEKRNVSKVLK